MPRVIATRACSPCWTSALTPSVWSRQAAASSFLCVELILFSFLQEQRLFQVLAELGVTCVTISKRVVLQDFHSAELNCGAPNKNGFVLRDITPEQE